MAPLLRTVREPLALVLRRPAVFRDAVFLEAVFRDAVFLDVAARLIFRALLRAPPLEALLRAALDFRAPPRPLLFRELADFREPRLPALPRGGIPLLREHALAAKELMQARTKPSLALVSTQPAVSKPVERRRLA